MDIKDRIYYKLVCHLLLITLAIIGEMNRYNLVEQVASKSVSPLLNAVSTPLKPSRLQLSTTPKVSPPKVSKQLFNSTAEKHTVVEEHVIEQQSTTTATIAVQKIVSTTSSNKSSPRSIPLPPSPDPILDQDSSPLSVPFQILETPLPSTSRHILEDADSPASIYYSPQSMPRSRKSTEKKRQLRDDKRESSCSPSTIPSPLDKQSAVALHLSLSPEVAGLQQQLYDNQQDLISHSEAHKQLLFQIIDSLKEELQARDGDVLLLTTQRDEARKGWDEAIEEAGLWEAQVQESDRNVLYEMQQELQEREVKLAEVSPYTSRKYTV